MAKLAGLPDSVLKRARAILEELESQSGRPAPAAPPEDQLSLSAMAESEAADTIRRTQRVLEALTEQLRWDGETLRVTLRRVDCK